MNHNSGINAQGNINETQAPMFQQISAPRLKSIGRAGLVDFMEAYEAYVELIKARKLLGESIQALSLKSCIDPKTLRTLAMMVLKVDKEDITDEMLIRYLQSAVMVNSSSTQVSTVEQILCPLKFIKHDEDADAGVFRFFSDALDLIAKSGMTSIWESSAKHKKAIGKTIVSFIQPASLKSVIERHIDTHAPQTWGDMAALYELVLSETRMAEKYGVRAANASRSEVASISTSFAHAKISKVVTSGTSAEGLLVRKRVQLKSPFQDITRLNSKSRR